MFTVDLGGSLAIASKGLFSTGVSTDLHSKPGSPHEVMKTYRSSHIPETWG